MLSWVNPFLEVGKTKKYGNGVFAKKNLKKDEVLTVFGGYVIPIDEFKKLSVEMQEYAYQISENLLFGPVSENEVCISEYFNHSCNPNAGFRDQLTLVSMKDINVGEEITFDYAVCMTSDILDLKCLCESDDCRKYIKGNDWKKTELQKKYNGYFQPYIREMIDKK